MQDRKLYPCTKCGTKVPIRSKGLCGMCRQQQRIEEGELTVKKYSIKPISTKRKKEKTEERECLDAFFKYQLLKLEKNPYSEESGTLISEPTTANICHILPKRKAGGFPSVKCNLTNCIFLTIQEHNRFDKLLDERDYEKLEKEFPKSWKKACEKLKFLLPLTSEKNKMYLSLTEYLKL